MSFPDTCGRSEPAENFPFCYLSDYLPGPDFSERDPCTVHPV